MEHQLISFSVLIIFLLFVFAVFKTWKKLKERNNFTRKLPPGPWRLPIIGNLHQLVSLLPHRRLRDMAKKYGPIMHLQLGEVSIVVISTADAAKEVLKTNDVVFADRPFVLGGNILFYNGNDIAFAPYGDYWRQLRKICILELLSAKRVQSFRLIREEEVSNLIKSISSSAGSPVNISKMVLSLSNTITSRAAFGKLKKQQQDAFIPLVHKCIQALGGLSISDVFPSIKSLHLISGIPEVRRLHKQADVVLEHIINEHRSSKATTKLGHESEAEDLVHVLLNLQDHGNLEFPLTSDNIKAVILDMFLAGSETSATTVEWAMSELLRNPRVMKKAQAEVRQVFEGKENIDETCLHELKYLNLVIKEALRLHVPAPLLIPRYSRERVEIGGYEIPAKTRVIINAWAIGRDQQYWSEPEIFHPERFLGSSIDFKGLDFQFIPFGAGRRMCPGMLYGIAVVALVLASLLYHFDWKLSSGIGPEDLDMSEVFGAITRRKHDLYLIPIPCN